MLLASGTGLIAATYGLVRLAYGLFLPDVQSALGFGTAEAGLISSGASLIYCLGAIIGFFAAATHPRSLVVAAALGASIGAAGMALAPDAATFAIFAIASSIGAGIASPGLVRIVQRNVARGTDARSQAIVNAGTGPGLVAAGILALVLLPDWRLAWGIVAVFTIAVAAGVVVLDRAGERADAVQLPTASWFRDHGSIIAAALLMGAGSAAVWNFGRTHLVAAGASDTASVAAWICLGLGGTAVIGTARIMSALQPRTALAVTTLTLAAASVTLALAPDVTTLALAACAAFGWSYTAATGSLIAWTSEIDPARAPAGTSLLFVVLVLGQAIGAAGVGALIAGTDSVTAFICAAGIAAVAAILPLARRRRASAPTEGRVRPELPQPLHRAGLEAAQPEVRE
jgi:predicted MFS family arabinose efflux permease